jgi:hypothetical protein
MVTRFTIRISEQPYNRGWLGVMIQDITPELKDKLRDYSESTAELIDKEVGEIISA